MISARKVALGVLGVLAAVAIACGGGSDSDAKGSVEGFFQAFNDHDANKMYDLFAKDCVKDVSKDEFKTAFEFGFTFIGDSKVKIDDIKIKEDGDSATATVTGKFEGGPLEGTPASEDDIALKKEDGKWKVADCSFAQLGGGQ